MAQPDTIDQPCFADRVSAVTQWPGTVGEPVPPSAARASVAPGCTPAQTQRLGPGLRPWIERHVASPLTALLRGAAGRRQEEPGRGAVVLALGFGQGPLALDGLDVLPTQWAPRILLQGLSNTPELLDRQRSLYSDHDGLLTALRLRGRVRRTWGRVAVSWGDPRRSVVRLRGSVDLVLLEPDRPETCPPLYSLDFLRCAVRLMGPGAVLVAACASPLLDGALLRLGLVVGHVVDATLPQGGTVASLTAAGVRVALPPAERHRALESVAGIAYRDPHLNWTPQHILQYHASLTERMRRRGMPSPLTNLDEAAALSPAEDAP